MSRDPWRHLVLGVVAYAAVGVQDDASRATSWRCADFVSASEWLSASSACATAYERAGDAESGTALARSLLMLGRDTEALALASTLDVSHNPDALQIVGIAHDRRGESEQARQELREAVSKHKTLGRMRDVARDTYAIAGSYWREGRLEETRAALDECTKSAQASQDARMLGFAQLMTADVLRKAGDLESAEVLLEDAGRALRPWRGDFAYVRLKVGLLHLAAGRRAIAGGAFEEALTMGKGTGRTDIEIAAHLNLAYLAHFDRDVAAGTHHLSVAAALGEPVRGVAYLYFQALLAEVAGEADQAEALLADAAGLAAGSEWAWDIAYERGRIASRLGDFRRAEAHWRDSVAAVEELRADLAASELQPWLLSQRREPYEALFALHARAQHFAEALAVLDRCTARAMIDRLAAPTGVAALPADAVNAWQQRADAARALSTQLLPVGASRPRGIDALSHFEADGRIWAIVLRQDAVSMTDVGAAVDLSRAVDAFAANPDDDAAATSIAAVLVPTEFATPTSAPLWIVPTGRFLRLPYAALRTRGRRLIEWRPIVFAPTLHGFPPKPHAASTATLVVADPRGDLPAARREAERVAGAMPNAQVIIGPEASRARVSTSPDLQLLHFATHAGVASRGAWLRLADGELTASDVLSMHLRADVVMLAGCASAGSAHDEMWGSLAAAFLANGSVTVVATLASVADGDAEALVTEFYERGGASTPVVALAEAQRRLAVTRLPHQWSRFAAFAVLR